MKYRLTLGSSSARQAGFTSATPRQIARLRFLGVRFNEPLSMGQAGTLIDDTKDDPAFIEKVSEWHQRKYALHPDLYPPTEQPQKSGITALSLAPVRAVSTDNFALPPRGHYEANATKAQKRKLEQLGSHDFAFLDLLGREQAAVLITLVETEVSRLAGEARRSEEARRYRASLFYKGSESSRSSSVAKWFGKGMGVAVMGIMVILVVRGTGWYPVSTHTVPSVRVEPTVSNPSPASIMPKLPQQDFADRFKQAVVQSQGRAVKKYPALAVDGSRFNTAFVARVKVLTQRRDALLQLPDWPEKLADQCAADIAVDFR